MNKENDIVTSPFNSDEKTFEELFRSHYKRLCNYAYTLLNDNDESEEAVQQVFIQLWEKRNVMEINFSVQAYLFRAVRNNCLNKIKHQKVKQAYTDEILQLNNESAGTHISYQEELKDQIHKAIESLPEQCRLIFKLSRYEELKYSEIAKELNISIKTVENQMGKALKVLREKLKDYLVILIFLFILNF